MESASNKRILQNLFRFYFARHPEIKLPLKDIKAVEAITQCNTPDRGYNVLSCPQGHGEKIQSHSCRHRSCPICADRARFEWIEKEKQRLIDCSHFHVIFTLPHEYITLWQYNRQWFTRHLFKACRDTLIELLEDTRHLGVTPGILMTLHTWGRQLNYHPHIHCLVTAGGVTKSNDWLSVEGHFLLPIRVVKALYRGKLQDWINHALQTGELRLPKQVELKEMLDKHRLLYRKEWSVRIQEKYDHGRGVVLYLARYMKGGPVKPRQLQVSSQSVTLSYRDHRDKRLKTLKLAMSDFINRILWHVPESGIHVVRHYGLYASRNQNQRQSLQSGTPNRETSGMTLKDAVNWCCETCGAVMQRTFTTYQRKDYENSYNKEASAKIVQQDVEDGTLEAGRSPPTAYLSPKSIFFSLNGVRLT